MRAGGLRRHKVEVQRAEISINDFGEEVRTWVTAFEMHADVVMKQGAEVVRLHELAPLYTMEFRVRHYHKVTEDMRIIFDGRVYNIKAVSPVSNRQMRTIIGELANG